jgi:hypothetical protein
MFFDTVNSEHYQTTSYGEGLNFTADWLTLPGNLVGTATSFGTSTPSHTIAGSIAFPGTAFQDFVPSNLLPFTQPAPPPSMPTISAPVLQTLNPVPQASAEVLAAATVLQKGPITYSGQGLHEASSVPRTAPTSLGPPTQHLRHQPLPDFRQSGSRLAEAQDVQPENLFREMMFGPSDLQARRVHSPRLVDMPRWGSDANFGRAGFVPQSPRDTTEAVEDDTVKKYMSLLGVDKITDVPNVPRPTQNGALAPPLNLRTSDSAALFQRAEDTGAPPRKRRKSGLKEESDESEDETPPTTANGIAGASAGGAATARPIMRRRRSKADATSNGGSAGPSNRRRKSTAANGGAKAPRENLTEEQKRENHIKSEQKRRTLIKDGFDDLCELVPGLKGGGFSKSSMLSYAADWLEDLLRGNQELSEQLAQLEEK